MLRIYLAGNVAIESAAGITSDWRAAGRQGRLAFAMLAAEHLRPVSRDELAEGLWPDDPPPSRERALTAVISKIRATLDDAGLCEIDISSQFGAYQMRLPVGASLSMIIRDDETLVPERRTVLRHGDDLLIVTPRRLREKTEQRLRQVSTGGRLAQWLDRPEGR